MWTRENSTSLSLVDSGKIFSGGGKWARLYMHASPEIKELTVTGDVFLSLLSTPVYYLYKPLFVLLNIWFVFTVLLSLYVKLTPFDWPGREWIHCRSAPNESVHFISLGLVNCLERKSVHFTGFKMSADDANSQTASSSEKSSISSSPDEKDSPRIEDKTFTEHTGEIGYFVKKGTVFVPVTNFSVACTGYVTENAECTSSEGFLFQVLPKPTLHGDEDTEVDQR